MSEHPFGKLTQAYHESAEAYARVQYEEGRVEFMLKRLHSDPRVRRDLRRRHELATGTPLLTFAAFNDAYPSFPLLLGCEHLKGLHLDARMFLPALMKNFADAPFVAPYAKFYEENSSRAEEEGRPVGLVFPRKGVVSGLVVYATDDMEAVPFAEKELFMPYASGKKKDRRFMIVRSFGKVLDAVHNGGHGWKPQADS